MANVGAAAVPARDPVGLGGGPGAQEVREGRGGGRGEGRRKNGGRERGRVERKGTERDREGGRPA